MYKYNEIKTVHLEVSSKCNAACPMCLRTVCGGPINEQLPLKEMSLDDIKKIFSPAFLKQLNRIYLCGNYGDPATSKDLVNIFKYYKDHNPELRIDLFTNGSIRNTKFWYEIGKLTHSVNFSIDGLSDTNHVYRRNTNFEKIMDNCASYMMGGGKAIWDYIVFKHNEHQVEEASKLSQRMGFHKFVIKKTGRFFSNTKSTGKDEQVVYDKNQNLEYYLQKPLAEKYQNKSLEKEQSLVKKYGSLINYLDKTPISCRVDKEKSVYISASGNVFPCCWTANQLYPWYFKPKGSPIWNLIDKAGGLNSLNAYNHSLESIINGTFFQETLPNSWSCSSIKDGKLKACAKTCGQEFNPFQSQFERSEISNSPSS